MFLKTTIGQYHTLIVLSEFFVFMETTNGPFEESANFFAPWAPSENEHEVIAKYKVDLKKMLCLLVRTMVTTVINLLK